LKQLRNRFTYANVMSSIAVFLVVGGASAFAALGQNTVGTKQLKKNAVTAAKIGTNAITAAKIADGAVTGAKINASTVGKVPSAASADSANTAKSADVAKSADTAKSAETAKSADTAASAANASNAQTVGGNTIENVNFTVDPPTGSTQILNLYGFTLTASCPSSSGLSVLVNGPNGSRVHSAGITTNESKVVDPVPNDALTPTSNLQLVPDNDLVNGHTELLLGDGSKHVSVIWQAESFPVASGPDCIFTGYAIG
jgi:hypothetical protein